MWVEGYSSPTRLLRLPLLVNLFAALTTLTSARVTIPPVFEVQPPRGELLFTVNHDPMLTSDPISIPCKADGLPHPTYSWLKDGSPLDVPIVNDEDDEEPRLEMADGEGTLTFNDPRPEDEGIYQCIAENKVGKAFSEIVSLRRAVMGNFLKSEPRVVTAILGMPLSLHCEPPEGYPRPSLHWVLQTSDGGLRSLDSERLTVDEEGTLWFSYITHEDASADALYACAASSATSGQQVFMVEGEEGEVTLLEEPPTYDQNDDRDDYDDYDDYDYEEDPQVTTIHLPTEYRMGNWVYLNVSLEADATRIEEEVAPTTQFATEEEQTVLKGDDIKLYCIFGGNPVPKITWWKESRSDVAEEDLSPLVEQYGKVLHLQDMEEEDMGTYFCSASNEVGDGDKIHEFNVNVEAAPEFILAPVTMNLPEGDTAIFTCEAEGDPEPMISWYKDGHLLETHGNSLEFSELSLDDKAAIACNASNTHGYVYKSVYLNVLSLPPEWMTEPKDEIALEGESLTLDCEAFGSPDPEVTWYKIIDGEEEPINDTDERYEMNDHNLMIKSVNFDSAGDFRCTSENKFGSISSDAKITVRGATHVSVSVSDDDAKAGEDVNVHCRVAVDEELEATVTWLKDDEILDTHNEDKFSVEKMGVGEGDDDDTDGQRVEVWVLKVNEAAGSDSGVYTCRVKTDLDETSDDTIVTVMDVPNPPNLDSIECAAREAYLHWSPTGDNNSPVLGYVIQYITTFHPNHWKDAENQIPASDNSYTVDISPGLNYTFRVLAYNSVGTSEPSDNLLECAPPGLPPDHGPHNVTLNSSQGPGTLVVNWDVMDPLQHNGPDFHYKVLWRAVIGDENEDNEDNEIDDDEDNEIDDDDDDYSYDYTTMAPDEERDYENENKIEYEDEYEDKDETVWESLIVEDWEQDSAVLKDLGIYEEYEVRVRAINRYGVSPIVDEDDILKAFSGEDEPSASPLNVEVADVSSRTAILTWDAIDEELVNGQLLGYKIDLQSKGGKEENGEDEEMGQHMTDQLEFNLEGLTPYTNYEVRVAIRNNDYTGPYSKPISFNTDEGSSGPVHELEGRPLGSNSLVVDWNPPFNPNGVITGYLVRYQVLPGEPSEETLNSDDTESNEPIQEYGAVIEKGTTIVKLAGLKEDTIYRVIVSALNAAGEGEDAFIKLATHSASPAVPAVPVFTWSLEKTYDDIDDDDSIDEMEDVDDDGDVDDDDIRNQNMIIGDTDQDGDVDEDDVLDTDGDGDIDQDDIDVADIDNDGDVDADDVAAADIDGDGDVDITDIGDEDGDGDFDGDDVIAADEDGDGDIDASDDDGDHVLLSDYDGDGDIDEHDIVDTDGDGDVDADDLDAADIDNDGDIDEDDLAAADRDGDGDVDAADIIDFDGDGRLDADDLKVRDKDGDGDIDRRDYALQGVFLKDTDGDGDVDSDDVLDNDNDGDIDERDMEIADIDNDGDVDMDDILAADRDGDGDIDASDIGDEDGDGDIDGTDVILADEDGDGDIDGSDDNEEHTLLQDHDGDGDIDIDDVIDTDGDGDIDIEDVAAADIDGDGDVDGDDLRLADMDGDGDIDAADVADFDGDGKVDGDDLEVFDRDNDGDIDSKDFIFRKTLLADTDGDGDIDEDDVLDVDGDGDIDAEDLADADIDDDGDIDEDDVRAGDRDGDGDIDASDIRDLDGDGNIDEDDLDVKDRDADGDIDANDFMLMKVFLEDTDGDGDVDRDDVLDTDGDGDIDDKDFDLADIDNDGDVDKDDVRAGDRDKDGVVDFNDIGDEDGDGDIDLTDFKTADKDGDGDIDASDDNGEFIVLSDSDGDGDIDDDDVGDLDGDGDIDRDDIDAADINDDGHVDRYDIMAADRDKDGDLDAADIVDMDGDGDVDGADMVAADRDNDGDIDINDAMNRQVFLKDTNGDGKINKDDVLDTNGDGVIDKEDYDVADVNNDGEIDKDDVLAGDQNGDGDIDFRDIGDADGDGDIDGDDLEAADVDLDGDVDLADQGKGVDVKINWHPDFEDHPGVDFYVQQRIKGSNDWESMPVERAHLYQTLSGLDPRRAYEVRVIAKDGQYETPSRIVMIEPTMEMDNTEEPTVGAVMEDSDPIMWTWFIIAVMAAVTMLCIVLFSVWVYNNRLARVRELRAALYEGYEPPQPEPPITKQQLAELEGGLAGQPDAEIEEEMTANYQRKQLASMMRRQETVQSCDSFASHDDDFAEYGDETMAIDLLQSVSLVPNPRHQKPPRF